MSTTREMLILAEKNAIELFEKVEKAGLIKSGKTELELSEEIQRIAKTDFGVLDHWGKRIVRTGANTLEPYVANPEDRLIKDGDILFFDFHPVFEGWEADLGRTYVLGNDESKLMIKRDVEEAWYIANEWYHRQTKLTGAEFFSYVNELTKQYGYEFGNAIAGHIVGKYPHEQPDDPNDLCLDVHPENHKDILSPDKNGHPRHWILELHFVDRKNQCGAFFEQLLKEY